MVLLFIPISGNPLKNWRNPGWKHSCSFCNSPNVMTSFMNVPWYIKMLHRRELSDLETSEDEIPLCPMTSECCRIRSFDLEGPWGRFCRPSGRRGLSLCWREQSGTSRTSTSEHLKIEFWFRRFFYIDNFKKHKQQ